MTRHALVRALLAVALASGLVTVDARAQSPPAESDYYTLTRMPLPAGVVLEAGGLAFNEQWQLAVTTRRGEVWLITNPGSANPGFERLARGLHEPLGIAYRGGAWYVAQRGELIKLEDRNRDGRADMVTTIYRWPLTGNYHEYSYGPVFLPNGDMIVTLNLSWVGRGASLAPWRGWMLRITPDGEMTPFATGLRSPLGFGLNADGDIFYAENQGDWIGSGWVTHLAYGDFAGNPEGLRWSHLPGSPLTLRYEDIDDSTGLTLYQQAKNIPALKPPAVWFPHAVFGVSTSAILLIKDDRQVGPFAGQLLVGDQGQSKIMRVFLEKVRGEYQGAVFGFREGFSSGVIRLAWGPDNELYAGMTNRGWASTGRAPYGIDRMTWNGTVPFEMHSIRAEADGFTIAFTKPIDAATAANVASYQITDFTYQYHRLYGSPIIERQNPAVTRVHVADDGRSVRLHVEGLREGFINEIKVEGVRSTEGHGVLHPVAYYTLNHLPDGGQPSADAGPGAVAAAAGPPPSKKVTQMPASWTSGPDRTVRLGTRPDLKFSLEEITVKAGSRIALTFSNDDDMLHNVVIVEPGAADRVGARAMQLGLDGHEMAYVPVMSEVLHHGSLLQPGAVETIYFTAPTTPGAYEYVCTFPGHYISMRGVLRVEP